MMVVGQCAEKVDQVFSKTKINEQINTVCCSNDLLISFFSADDSS